MKKTITQLAIAYFFFNQQAIALPPPEDIPEEILRTEIILDGRSPIDGKPLKAEEYQEVLAKIKEKKFDPQLDPQVREIIFLLELRKILKTIAPFY